MYQDMCTELKSLRLVDMETNTWSSLSLNFKINLILSLYQQKWMEHIQLWGVWRNQNSQIREAGKFEILRAILWVNSYWSAQGEKKSGLRRELKVSTLDIQIKQSRLKD